MDKDLLLTLEEQKKICGSCKNRGDMLRDECMDITSCNQHLEAQIKALQSLGWGDVEQAKREERERIFKNFGKRAETILDNLVSDEENPNTVE